MHEVCVCVPQVFVMTYEPPSREQQGRVVHSVSFLFVPKSEGTMAVFLLSTRCNPTATRLENWGRGKEKLLQTLGGQVKVPLVVLPDRKR